MTNHVTRLLATGDWFSHGPMSAEAAEAEGTASVLGLLRQADLAFVNLETPLTTRGVAMEKLSVLRADPALAESLLAAGVDIVTLANNHMLDYGPDGLFDTLDTLDGRGIPHVGAGRTLAEARAPHILRGPGGTIGFLGFASTLPQGFAAGPNRPGVAPIRATTAFVVEAYTLLEQPGTAPPIATYALEMDLEETVESVRALRPQVDYLVVAGHWGVVGQDLVMDYQREVAHALIDAGADLILGHHPHRLHGVEWYRGKPVFYSLGNFVFEAPPVGGGSPFLSWKGGLTIAAIRAMFRREGLLVEACIEGGELRELSAHPVSLGANGYPVHRPDSAHDFALLLQDLSDRENVQFTPRDGRVIVSPASA
jgi:poly-gamma-glutamate capsule biosynthesis protein CapA/YwtB (metallophosphatase superfamily)